jgi:hypothetical protein
MINAYECDECGAYVAHHMKATHKDEHDALVEALTGLLLGQKALMALIKQQSTGTQQ